MAKKRKLAHTKPEPEPEPVPEPEPESESESESESEEEFEEEEEEEEEEEGEEEEDEEEEERPPSTAANGSRSVSGSAVRELLSPLPKDQLISLLTSAALSHPSVLSSIHATTCSVEVPADDDRAQRELFVFGFGKHATSDSLHSFFSKYGELERAYHVLKRSGDPMGYGFVCFKTRAAAQKAISDPNKVIGKRSIICRLAAPRASRKIFVGNVLPEIDPKKLLDFFATFGEIEKGPSGMDAVTGRPKGFAIFVYKTVEGAKRVLEQPHKTFEGIPIHCYIATAKTNSTAAKTGPAALVPPKPKLQAQAPPALQATGNSERKIYVRNVVSEIDPKKLLDFFAMFGDIEEGPIGMDTVTGRPKGFAIFVYKTVEGAKRVLEQPHKTFEGIPIHCSIATAKTNSTAAKTGPAALVPPKPKLQVHAPPALQATGNSERKIYVRNVVSEIDPKKLLDFFAMFGDIEEGPIGMDTVTGLPRGFAIFVYKTVEGAKRVLEQPHKNFEGHRLHCSISTAAKFGKEQILNNKHLVAAEPQAATRPVVPPPMPAAGAGYSQPPPPAAATAAAPVPAVNAGMNPALGQAAGLDPALQQAVGQAVGQALTAMGLTNLLGGRGGAVANQGVQAPVGNTAVPQVQDGYGAGAQVQGGYGPGHAVDNRYGAGTGAHNRYLPGATGYGLSTGVHGGHGAGTMEYGGYGAGTVAQSGYGVSSHVQGGYGSPAVGQGGAGQGYPQGGYGGYRHPPPYR